MIQALAIKLLFKTISKIVEKIDDNKMAKAHDKRLKDLEKNSHQPIFKKSDYKSILDRLNKLESKK